MLTVKAPIKLTCRSDLVSSQEGFYQRIAGNYSLLHSGIGQEELLHMVSSPPEIYLVGEGGGVSVHQQNSFYQNKENRVEIVNNLINRITLSEQFGMTYQDRVYITMALEQLGITDVKTFMTQVSQLKEEITSTNELINLYWNHAGELQKLIREYHEQNESTTKVEGVSEYSYPLHLHEEIMNRLQTGAIYQILENFQSNRFVQNRISQVELLTAEQNRTTQNILLNKLENAVRGEENPLTYRYTNLYEEVTTNEQEVTNETVTRQITAAVLYDLVDHVYRNRYMQVHSHQNNWFHMENALYKIAENTMHRIYERYNGDIRINMQEDNYSVQTNQIRNREVNILQQIFNEENNEGLSTFVHRQNQHFHEMQVEQVQYLEENLTRLWQQQEEIRQKEWESQRIFRQREINKTETYRQNEVYRETLTTQENETVSPRIEEIRKQSLNVSEGDTHWNIDHSSQNKEYTTQELAIHRNVSEQINQINEDHTQTRNSYDETNLQVENIRDEGTRIEGNRHWEIMQQENRPEYITQEQENKQILIHAENTSVDHKETTIDQQSQNQYLHVEKHLDVLEKHLNKINEENQIRLEILQNRIQNNDIHREIREESSQSFWYPGEIVQEKADEITYLNENLTTVQADQLTHTDIANQYTNVDEHVEEIRKQVDQLNEQNLETYNQYQTTLKQIREKYRKEPVDDPTQLTRRDSLKALENPEELMLTYREEARKEQMRQQQIKEEIRQALPESSQQIFQILEEYIQNPAATQEGMSVRVNDTGRLNADMELVVKDRELKERQTEEKQNIIREVSENMIERFREPGINDRSTRLNLWEKRNLSFVHKTTENQMDEQVMEQILEQNRLLSHRNKENIKVEENREITRTQVKNITTQEITDKQIREITGMVQQGLHQQIGEISDKVYNRLERRLQNERKRRGY